MFLYLFALAAVVVSAASGALAAARKGFDLIGIAVIAVATALGGGTIRDLLLDRHPIFWIADPTHIAAALVAAMLIVIYVRFAHPPWSVLLVADALGLALFTISGAQLTQLRGHGAIVTVLMGAITGTAGGVVRDVLSAEVPILFQPKETLYATAAIAGAIGYLVLEWGGVDRRTAAILGMIIVAGLRFAAIAWRWRLPVVELPPER